jgi:GNAT superfamily N-acetyltransferase
LTGFVTARLSREHDRAGFASGVEALDRYFRELAPQDVKRRVAGCFVALDDDGVVAGYYTLAATSVVFDALPADITRKLPRYPVIPAILLGRLAVAIRNQSQGLGRALVADAITRTDGFGIGAFAMIVDPKDDRAARFYARMGFAPIPEEARRMFLPMATGLRGVGAAIKAG